MEHKIIEDLNELLEIELTLGYAKCKFDITHVFHTKEKENLLKQREKLYDRVKEKLIG